MIPEMTAEAVLEIQQQHDDGKECQVADGSGNWIDIAGWRLADWLIAFKYGKRLRLKPQPKHRPWKLGEVPQFLVVRGIRGKMETCVDFLIVALDKIFEGVASQTALNCLFDLAEHTTDGGKTWKPCGLPE